MKIFDQIDPETGNMAYYVCIMGVEPPLRFATPGEREKYLYRIYRRWLEKLESQAIREAMEWLWQERQEELLRILKKEEYLSDFWALILPIDQYYCGLQDDIARAYYIKQLAMDWVEIAFSLALTANRLAPMPDEEDEDGDKGGGGGAPPPAPSSCPRM